MTGGFSRKSNLSGGVTPAINVTPLVDVVLVLLIIFMVVAPQLDKDISLELPQIVNADPDVKTAEPLKISMPKAGEYYLDDQAYALDKLVEYLTAEHAVDPMRRLVVRADAGLKYKEVREFENRMQQVGFPGLSFVVNQKYRAGGSVMVSADSARAAPAGTDSATGEVASSEAGSENAAPVAPAPGGN